jgi:hypothetical protein
MASFPAIAGRVDLGSSVSIEEPVGLAPVKEAVPGMAQAWATDDRQLSVEVIFAPLTARQVSDGAGEYNSWPGVGQAFANSYGNTAAKTISAGVGALCEANGVPVARDLDRLVLHVETTITCATKPKPLIVKSEVVRALNAQGSMMIRVTGFDAQGANVKPLAAKVWESLRIEESARVAAPSTTSRP